MHPNLSAVTMTTGIAYADRTRERHGDYLRLAFLSFSTLELTWAPNVVASGSLRAAVESDAAAIQARRGEQYLIDTCGHTVTLGGKGR